MPTAVATLVALVCFASKGRAETLRAGTQTSTLQGGIQQKVIQAQVSEKAEEAQIVFLFDNSGSMQLPLPSGESRLDAARSALNAAVSDRDAEGWMGLRAFGTSRVESCGGDDSELLVAPISNDSRQKIPAQSKQLKGTGAVTQFGRALQVSIEKDFDLKSIRLKKIVLLTDGEDSCMSMTQICQIAKDAKKRIKGLQIDVIAYSIQGPEVRKGLRCLANATSGQFFEADDITQIKDSFLKTTRKVQGTVVGQDTFVSPTSDSSVIRSHDDGSQEISW